LAEFSYSLFAISSASATLEIASVTLYGLSLTTVGGADPWGIHASVPKGDLKLSDTGELVFTDGAEQARQEVQCRLCFFLGEYFLDTRQGLPYYRDVFVKNPNRETVLSLFERTALSVPGIVQLSELSYVLDTKTRRLTVEGEAFWIDGQPVPIDLSYIV
jgi:hypothetical protein